METTLIKKRLRATNLCIGFSKGQPINPNPWEFSILEHSVAALIGANGSGKTTVLRAMLGENVLLKGGVYFDPIEKPVHLWNCRELSRIFSYLPQEPVFDAYQTVLNHLQLAFTPELGLLRRAGGVYQARIGQMMSDFGLNKFQNKALIELSTGERQRVFLARVLLQKSEVVLLDEPTNHLDPDGVEIFWSLLKKNRGDKTVLIATHDLVQVEKNCSQVLALYLGNLCFSGDVNEFKAQSISEKVFPRVEK